MAASRKTAHHSDIKLISSSGFMSLSYLLGKRRWRSPWPSWPEPWAAPAKWGRSSPLPPVRSGTSGSEMHTLMTPNKKERGTVKINHCPNYLSRVCYWDKIQKTGSPWYVNEMGEHRAALLHRQKSTGQAIIFLILIISNNSTHTAFAANVDNNQINLHIKTNKEK